MLLIQSDIISFRLNMNNLRENNIYNSSNFDIENNFDNSTALEEQFYNSNAVHKLELYASASLCVALGFTIGGAIGLLYKAYCHSDYGYTEIN